MAFRKVGRNSMTRSTPVATVRRKACVWALHEKSKSLRGKPIGRNRSSRNPESRDITLDPVVEGARNISQSVTFLHLGFGSACHMFLIGIPCQRLMVFLRDDLRPLKS